MPVINRMAEHRKLAAYSDAVRSNPQHAARLDRAIAMLRSGKRHNNTRPGEIADSGLCRVFFVGSNAPRLYYRTGAEGLEIWGESSFNDGDACRDFLRGLDWSE